MAPGFATGSTVAVASCLFGIGLFQKKPLQADPHAVAPPEASTLTSPQPQTPPRARRRAGDGVSSGDARRWWSKRARSKTSLQARKLYSGTASVWGPGLLAATILEMAVFVCFLRRCRKRASASDASRSIEKGPNMSQDLGSPRQPLRAQSFILRGGVSGCRGEMARTSIPTGDRLADEAEPNATDEAGTQSIPERLANTALADGPENIPERSAAARETVELPCAPPLTSWADGIRPPPGLPPPLEARTPVKASSWELTHLLPPSPVPCPSPSTGGFAESLVASAMASATARIVNEDSPPVLRSRSFHEDATGGVTPRTSNSSPIADNAEDWEHWRGSDLKRTPSITPERRPPSSEKMQPLADYLPEPLLHAPSPLRSDFATRRYRRSRPPPPDMSGGSVA